MQHFQIARVIGNPFVVKTDGEVLTITDEMVLAIGDVFSVKEGKSAWLIQKDEEQVEILDETFLLSSRGLIKIAIDPTVILQQNPKDADSSTTPKLNTDDLVLHGLTTGQAKALILYRYDEYFGTGKRSQSEEAFFKPQVYRINENQSMDLYINDLLPFISGAKSNNFTISSIKYEDKKCEIIFDAEHFNIKPKVIAENEIRTQIILTNGMQTITAEIVFVVQPFMLNSTLKIIPKPLEYIDANKGTIIATIISDELDQEHVKYKINNDPNNFFFTIEQNNIVLTLEGAEAIVSRTLPLEAMQITIEATDGKHNAEGTVEIPIIFDDIDKEEIIEKVEHLEEQILSTANETDDESNSHDNAPKINDVDSQHKTQNQTQPVETKSEAVKELEKKYEYEENLSNTNTKEKSQNNTASKSNDKVVNTQKIIDQTKSKTEKLLEQIRKAKESVSSISSAAKTTSEEATNTKEEIKEKIEDPASTTSQDEKIQNSESTSEQSSKDLKQVEEQTTDQVKTSEKPEIDHNQEINSEQQVDQNQIIKEIPEQQTNSEQQLATKEESNIQVQASISAVEEDIHEPPASISNNQQTMVQENTNEQEQILSHIVPSDEEKITEQSVIDSIATTQEQFQPEPKPEQKPEPIPQQNQIHPQQQMVNPEVSTIVEPMVFEQPVDNSRHFLQPEVVSQKESNITENQPLTKASLTVNPISSTPKQIDKQFSNPQTVQAQNRSFNQEPDNSLYQTTHSHPDLHELFHQQNQNLDQIRQIFTHEDQQNTSSMASTHANNQGFSDENIYFTNPLDHEEFSIGEQEYIDTNHNNIMKNKTSHSEFQHVSDMQIQYKPNDNIIDLMSLADSGYDNMGHQYYANDVIPMFNEPQIKNVIETIHIENFVPEKDSLNLAGIINIKRKTEINKHLFISDDASGHLSINISLQGNGDYNTRYVIDNMNIETIASFYHIDLNGLTDEMKSKQLLKTMVAESMLTLSFQGKRKTDI